MGGLSKYGGKMAKEKIIIIILGRKMAYVGVCDVFQ